MAQIKIYLAGRANLVARPETIRKHLQGHVSCLLYLPHELVPVDIPKTELPDEVFQRCVEHIDKADAVVAAIDSYGRDTSWEIGYCSGLGRKVIAFTENSEYQADFMIRG